MADEATTEKLICGPLSLIYGNLIYNLVICGCLQLSGDLWYSAMLFKCLALFVLTTFTKFHIETSL